MVVESVFFAGPEFMLIGEMIVMMLLQPPTIAICTVTVSVSFQRARIVDCSCYKFYRFIVLCMYVYFRDFRFGAYSYCSTWYVVLLPILPLDGVFI